MSDHTDEEVNMIGCVSETRLVVVGDLPVTHYLSFGERCCFVVNGFLVMMEVGRDDRALCRELDDRRRTFVMVRIMGLWSPEDQCLNIAPATLWPVCDALEDFCPDGTVATVFH